MVCVELVREAQDTPPGGLCHIAAVPGISLCGRQIEKEWCCVEGHPPCKRPPCEACQVLADRRSWESRRWT